MPRQLRRRRPPTSFNPSAGATSITTAFRSEEDNSLKYGALNLAYDFHWATLMSATSYGRFNLHFVTGREQRTIWRRALPTEILFPRRQ